MLIFKTDFLLVSQYMKYHRNVNNRNLKDQKFFKVVELYYS